MGEAEEQSDGSPFGLQRWRTWATTRCLLSPWSIPGKCKRCTESGVAVNSAATVIRLYCHGDDMPKDFVGNERRGNS